MRIRAITYNIHKGFHHFKKKRVLHLMREALRAVPADIIFLQEVLGFDQEKEASQLEFLADEIWHHYAYGKNAVTSLGHHGNAILSKFPILFSENTDISTNQLEKRGILHAILEIPEEKRIVHALSIHLGLLEADRRSQLRRVCHRVQRMIHRRDPVLIGGDFNDWRERASILFEKRLDLKEAHLSRFGIHAKTFPAWLPTLKLDRIYSRGGDLCDVRVLSGSPWNQLSDHAALYAEFDFNRPESIASSSDCKS